MIAIRPTSRADMERRAAEALAARRPSSSRAPIRPPARNVSTVLTLGNTEYFNFRGRPFGCPPVPLADGERLLSVYLRAVDAGHSMRDGASHGRTDRVAMAEYYDALRELPALLWSLCRPVGKFWRFMRRIGLHRNPFTKATERELLDISDFFYRRRTRSGDRFRPAMARPRERATSSPT